MIRGERRPREGRQPTMSARTERVRRCLTAAALALITSPFLLSQAEEQEPLWLFAGPDPFAPEAEEEGPAESSADVEKKAVDPAAALEDLQRVLTAQDENLRRQEEAWPNRRQDQLGELPAPPAVQELRATYGSLQREKRKILHQIERAAVEDPSFLIPALRDSSDAEFVTELLPVVRYYGREKDEFLPALKSLARRFDPCPTPLIESLASDPREEASFFLLELGKLKKDARWLEAAGRSGRPGVLDQLIQMAEGENSDLAEASRRALERLSPPPLDHRPEELGQLIVWRLERSRSVEIQRILVTYLGLLEDEYYVPILERVYESTEDDRLRLAVIGAMGNAGEAAGAFLLARLREAKDSFALQRACIHSLGTARYRPAAGWLLRFLHEPRLKRYALRALRRISGKDFPPSRAVWVRWWTAQPESKGDEKDRDEA